MKTDPEQPMRKCVGGGGEWPREALERFIWDERVGLIFDARRKAPGRGAWLKPDSKTLKKACESGFSRAFKTKVQASPGEIASVMREGIETRLREHLLAAIRSKQAWTGGPAVEEGMKRDDVQLLLVAKNAGESTHKKFVSNAERKEIPYVIAMEAESLGRLMGRDRVAVLGLTGDLARKIEVDVAHLETLNAFEG
ncbi:DUF448 domain-containing protein [Microvenator marinus]|uniref:DUF448 domain-containing protein n=1 Tax=Microvenator marinus TaxID=2600177 RepID=A0A5B8XJY2_9DELT|nr:DUF448 domain-containing protein [Microvenator marinus]QED25835.1 DUF448 domain-containing protein [Microvenator marinus]